MPASPQSLLSLIPANCRQAIRTWAARPTGWGMLAGLHARQTATHAAELLQRISQWASRQLSAQSAGLLARQSQLLTAAILHEYIDHGGSYQQLLALTDSQLIAGLVGQLSRDRRLPLESQQIAFRGELSQLSLDGQLVYLADVTATLENARQYLLTTTTLEGPLCVLQFAIQSQQDLDALSHIGDAVLHQQRQTLLTELSRLARAAEQQDLQNTLAAKLRKQRDQA